MANEMDLLTVPDHGQSSNVRPSPRGPGDTPTRALVRRSRPGVWVTHISGRRYLTDSAQTAWRLIDDLGRRA